MKNLKSYIAGLLTGLLLVSVPIFAESYTKAIDALVNFTKIQVNGADVQSDNFVVDGKTYVWIRDVASMLNKDIVWDEATNTANIVDAAEKPKIVAKVENSEISERSLLSMMKSIGSTVPNEQVKSNALDNLINLKIAIVEANKLGLSVGQNEIDSLKGQLEQVKAIYGEDNFKSMLAKMYMTEQEYINMNVDGMLEQKLYEKMLSETQITDDQIQKAYDSNKDQFLVSTTKHILFKTVDANGKPLSDDKIKAQEKLANDVYESLLNGVKFDKAMAVYSEDESTKTNIEGFSFGKGEMVKAYENAAFTQDVGKIYPPVKSEYGYHIILVTKRDVTPLNEVKEKCKTFAFNTIYKDYIKTLKGTLNIQIFDDVLNGVKID